MLRIQNVSLFTRARNICCESKISVQHTKKVSDLFQKHFVSAANVSRYAQLRNKTFVLFPPRFHTQGTS